MVMVVSTFRLTCYIHISHLVFLSMCILHVYCHSSLYVNCFHKKTVICFMHIKGVLAERSSRGFGLLDCKKHNSYYHKVRIKIILAFGENIYKTYLHIMQM